MNETVHIHQLHFHFPKQPPLFESLDLSIPEGSTFGILGPNGAGKSTLIKLVIGLIPQDRGNTKVFGKKITQHRSEILRNIGFLLEAPRLYHHLTGRDNLKVFATYRQVPFERVEELLTEVGLSQYADKHVRYYSTGMKQRLAIAIALLHDPALLILDEPTNGLDPQGIAEIRHLVRELKQKPGRTIIFCSHILHEVQQVCDHIGILNRGKFVFQGPLQSLKASHTYLIETDNPEMTVQVLTKLGYQGLRTEKTEVSVSLENTGQINEAIDRLRASGINILQVKRVGDDLENTYLRLIQA